jgi:hypothetical protein
MIRLGTCLAVALAISAAALTSPARADVTWTLHDVSFDDGGTVLNGAFTINVYGYLTDSTISVTTSAGTHDNTSGYQLLGELYNADLVAGEINNIGGTGLPDDTVTLFSSTNGYQGVLTLQFQDVLTTAVANNPIVGGVGGPSWECGVGWSCPPYEGTPIRYVTSGYASSAAPVPEAPTWAMMIVGVGLLAYGHILLRGRPQLGAT